MPMVTAGTTELKKATPAEPTKTQQEQIDAACRALAPIIREKMTVKLAAGLADEKNLGIARFEVGRTMDELLKWFGK